MDNDSEIYDELHTGRRVMIEVLAELTTLAYRAGVDYEKVLELHGRFFDGNVMIKRATRRLALLGAICGGR